MNRKKRGRGGVGRCKIANERSIVDHEITLRQTVANEEKTKLDLMRKANHAAGNFKQSRKG